MPKQFGAREKSEIRVGEQFLIRYLENKNCGRSLTIAGERVMIRFELV